MLKAEMGRLPNNIEHRTFNIEHRMKAAGAGGKMGTREARPLRGSGEGEDGLAASA
jgi:hypothetical protein